MAITYKGQENGGVKEIEVAGDEEKEVIIRHKAVRRRSAWNWHEDFTLAWSKTL